MSRLTTFRHDLFNALTQLCGYDVCILDADPCINRYKFMLAPPSEPGGCECWFLGYHLTVSPWDITPQRRTAESS